MKDYVYDLEFYPNFFSGAFKSFPDGKERRFFEISTRRDDRKELLKFLKTENLRLIGYNNNHYDYVLLHFLLETPEITLMSWFRKVQKNIFNDDQFIIWESQRLIPQIDLLKINHYDNMAKRTSLKWLEFTMRWHKVQDLPLTPNVDVPEDMMDLMCEYNWNDVIRGIIW